MMLWSAHLVLLALVMSGVLPVCVQGVTLSLRGNSFPTDGSGRIVITDINPAGDNNVDALICRSELPTSASGNWFLHPTQQTTDDSDRIVSIDSRGWHRNRATVTIITGVSYHLVRLRRDDSAAIGGRALEGVFTCHIPGDTNTPISVGIYYPISSVDVTINVESSRQGTFSVTCTASGGTVVSSSLTGSGVVALALQPVVSIERTGQNTYSVTSGTLSGRSNGDIYQCTAAADLSSPHPTDSAVLRVAADPIIISLVSLVSATVRVEWSQPSGGASVTGYVVHYSDGSTDRSISVGTSSTSADITGLINDGRTYSISVEATSEQLSGVSDTVDITVEAPPGPVVITSSSPSFFKISITWDPPEMRNGIIITYEVSYRPASAPQTITTMNTTDLDTSFTTTQGRLELGTAYIFTVTAFTGVGRGEIATASISTLARPAVQGVAVTELNATAVTVSWNAVVIPDFPIDYYTVLYSLVESQRRRRQDGVMNTQFPSTATSGVIAGLNSPATYQFQVFATGTVDGTPLDGERSSPTSFVIDDSTSDESTVNEATPIIIGVIIAVVGVVFGTVGISIAIYVVVKNRAVSGSKAGVTTEDNPAYGVSGPISGVGVATEDNPAYGVSGPHGKRGQAEQMYEMPEFIQPPPATHEAV